MMLWRQEEPHIAGTPSLQGVYEEGGVPLDGLEPPTQRLGRARSIHLSYRGVPHHFMCGSAMLASKLGERYNSGANSGRGSAW